MLLQNIDRQIREKTIAREELLAEIATREKGIEENRADGGTLRAEWEKKDKLRRDKEKELQDEGRKAAEKRMKMAQIKNIKEMQALQREIDLIKQGNSQLEDELISVLEELEAEGNILKEKEDGLKAMEEEWRGKRQEAEAQLAELDRAVTEASKTRGETASQLNGDLIGRYELIFARRGGIAVVMASGGICQGCHMNIPPQLWNEIIRSDQLILCPSCHRILYYQPPVSDDKQV
jgi:predicted  nucleic acid-binding Zn-ribbon protein